MKRFTKIALVVAVVMTVIGIVCLGISFTMGFTAKSFMNMIQQGKFNFDFRNENLIYEEQNEKIMKIDEIYENLDIEFPVGTLKIYTGDVEQIQIEQETVPGFKVYTDERTLHIESSVGFNNKGSDQVIKLVIPQNMKFNEVDLEIGAGDAEIEGLIANKINIEVGAGRLYMKPEGAQDNYNYEVECGIGEIKIGKDSYSGLGTAQKIINPGANRWLDVECGAGKIQIDFNEGGF